MTVRVGVIVPCRNEEATLRTCLLSLRRQQPEIARIVVVDNGSTDGSRAIALELADLVIDLPGARISALRNTGAAALPDVDVLGFVDADCELDPGWLAAGLTALDQAVMVGSRTLAPPDAAWVAGRWARIEQRRAHEASLLWSQHLLMRRETFEQHHGFDEAMPTGEDSDLSARVRTGGGRIDLVEDMIVVHHGFPETLSRFVRRELWHTSTPGWYARMAPKSRKLVLLATAWTGAGVTSVAWSVGSGRTQPIVGWVLASASLVPVLGWVAGGSVRHSLRDGTLIGIWAFVRAVRLWLRPRTEISRPSEG